MPGNKPATKPRTRRKYEWQVGHRNRMGIPKMLRQLASRYGTSLEMVVKIRKQAG